jgi:hypothetical protein
MDLPTSYTPPQIAKALVALVVAALTALATMLADGSIELVELGGFVGALVTAWGVFAQRNAPVPDTGQVPHP